MPVFFEEIIHNRCRVTVWHITESEENLYKAYAPHKFTPSVGKNAVRKKQSLAAAVCAKYTTEKAEAPFQGILKNEREKPFLTGNIGNISLAHTRNYAAASFCRYGATGIDLEHLANTSRVRSVVSKFMNAREIQKFGTDEQASLLCWSAKEALYKLFEEPLSLKSDMDIVRIDGGKSGTIHASISISTGKTDLLVNYRIFDEFVLTCAFKDC